MSFIRKILIFFTLLSIFYSQNSHRCSLVNTELRSRPETQTSSLSETGYFLIHYDITGEHAPSQTDLNLNLVPDYIDEVGIAIENSRNILVSEMNFLSEVPDNDGIYDIYIQDMPAYFYGVNYQDDNNSQASYIVIDNEYEDGEFLTSGLNTMRLTLAHEFFHAIQRAYISAPGGNDGYFWEMSSTWIEDIIVPTGDDYIYWVDDFFDHPDQNISDTNGYSIAFFGHYLTNIIEGESNQIASNIMREIWIEYANNNNSFESIDLILNNYNSDFANAWADFCSRNHFNGLYDDMQNDIYFYLDQSLIEPIPINSMDLFSDDQTGQIILSEESAEFKGYRVLQPAYIHFDYSTTPSSSPFIGYISIKSSIGFDSNEIIKIENDMGPYLLQQFDYIYLTLTAYQNTILDIDIDFEVYYNSGDSNLNGTVDISDVVLLVNFILGYSVPDQTQLIVADINNDGVLNIFDILLMVDIILNN